MQNYNLKRNHTKEVLLAAGIFAVVLVIAFFDVFFCGKTFKLTTGNPQALATGVYGQEDNKPTSYHIQTTDISYIEEGYLKFIKRNLKKGILPLWDPHQGCGYPFISQMQVGLFFPLNFLFYILPNSISWDAHILSRYFVGMMLIFWFMRVLRFSFLQSLCAGIVYILTGPMLLIQASFTNVEILLPFVLLVTEKLIKKPGVQHVCLFACGLALTCLAGNPEHVFLVNGFGFLYFLFRLFTRRPRPAYGKIIIQGFWGYLLGFALSSIVVFPFLRDWLGTFWHTHGAGYGRLAEGQALLQGTIVGLFSPHFFQKAPVAIDFTRYSWLGHFGVLPLGLVFLGLLKNQRQRLHFFFAFIAFLLFSKSYLDAWWINWIGDLPLIGMVRFLFHTPQLIGLCVAVLSGMGLRVLVSKERLAYRGLFFSSAVVLILLAYLVHLKGLPDRPLAVRSSLVTLCWVLIFQVVLWWHDYLLYSKKIMQKRFSRQAWLKMKQRLKRVLPIVFLCAMFVELFIYIPRGRVRRFNSYPQVPYIEFLKKFTVLGRAYGIFFTFLPNTALGYQVYDFGICQNLFLDRYVNFVNTLVAKNWFAKGKGEGKGRAAFWLKPVTFAPWAEPFMNLASVFFTVSPLELDKIFIPARSESFPKPIYKDEVQIFFHPNALQRHYIVRRAIFEPDKEKSLKVVRSVYKMLRDTVVVEGARDEDIASKLSYPEKIDLRDSTQMVKYTPNEVILKSTLSSPGFLVLTDSYHPDWRVTVDGKEQKIYPANYLFRAVFLDEGEHTIRFYFVPWAFYWGTGITLGALIFMLFLLGFPYWRARRKIRF